MNERIKELAVASQLVYEADGKLISAWEHYVDLSEELEKFAELIVRECIDIVEQDMKLAHIQMIPLTLEKYANGRLKEKIREHFGVEK